MSDEVEMKIIEEVEYTTVEIQRKDKSTHPIWRITKHTSDPDMVGETVYCGLPGAKLFPVGTTITHIVKVPK